MPLYSQNTTAESWRVMWQVPGQELTGLIICQKQDTGQVRIVMINELGVKYFDASLEGDSVSFRYLFPPLTRESFLPIVNRAVYLVGLFIANDIHSALSQGNLQVDKGRRGNKFCMYKGPGRAVLRIPENPISGCRVKSFPIKCNFTLEKLDSHVER